MIIDVLQASPFPDSVRDPESLTCLSAQVLVAGSHKDPTSIRSDVSDDGASVSSKTIRSTLADVRLKGRTPRKKPYLNLQ
ncbi:hypothetical protein TNCV_1347351 [Trichonephila clavipes]|nr:hypothetical protein TNCV_1347351 [Trichonephila clavipes]